MTVTQAVVTIVAALLTTGGLAWARALLRGVGSVRAGVRATERAAVADLAQRAADAEDDRDYWRNTAGGYAYQLRLAGVVPVPADPVPPSARRRSPRADQRRLHAQPPQEDPPD
ncbi:hypothetical protein AB0N38_18780 [Micromonospora aurantiaca]|uniref:Uncharacterized protein n=1 Tax=Micromonospora aurantiaca (nom. illeg.) TaxID=47850 RepID=A0A6N3JUV5_9ACTN|nr:hypothetical protein [Micromonospora aurantiaca]AXH88803.1 hypothetical protein DVH21_02035 [Micromonospora aurantiaca]